MEVLTPIKHKGVTRSVDVFVALDYLISSSQMIPLEHKHGKNPLMQTGDDCTVSWRLPGPLVRFGDMGWDYI